MRQRIGVAAAAVLTTDALAHLYWATGATWPADNARDLSLAVLNMEVPFTPRVLLPLAAVLLAGAWAMLTADSRYGRLAGLAVAAGTLVRGVVGVGWMLGIGADTQTPFYWLNLVYTPVCLALFAASLAVRRAPSKALS